MAADGSMPVRSIAATLRDGAGGSQRFEIHAPGDGRRAPQHRMRACGQPDQPSLGAKHNISQHRLCDAVITAAAYADAGTPRTVHRVWHRAFKEIPSARISPISPISTPSRTGAADLGTVGRSRLHRPEDFQGSATVAVVVRFD